MREILVVGTVCWDRLIRVPHMPMLGKYMEADEVVEGPGGEAFNTALGLQRLGMSALVYGNPIGSGLAADRLRQGVEKVGLRRAVLPGGRNRVPQCDIIVTPDGQRTMVGDGFADLPALTENLHITPLRGGIVSGDMNLGDSIWRMYDMARTAGMTVYAMDSPPRNLGLGSVYQSSTDWFGQPGDDSQNRAAVAELSVETGGLAILTDGMRGLYVSTNGKTERFAPFPLDGAVDSTGAGDAFRAGMLYGLAQGWKLGHNLSFAAACGALVCRGLGATTTSATKAEVEAFVGANRTVFDSYLRIADLLA